MYIIVSILILTMETNVQTNPFQTSPSSDRDVITAITDPTRLLLNIELTLRNEQWVEDANGNASRIPRPYGKPKLNDEGVSEVMRILSNEINENTLLSNYTEIRVKQIMKRLAGELIFTLGAKYKEYQIDVREFELIIIQILNPIESSYRRSIGWGTLKELMGNVKEIRSMSDRSEQKSLF